MSLSTAWKSLEKGFTYPDTNTPRYAIQSFLKGEGYAGKSDSFMKRRFGVESHYFVFLPQDTAAHGTYELTIPGSRTKEFESLLERIAKHNQLEHAEGTVGGLIIAAGTLIVTPASIMLIPYFLSMAGGTAYDLARSRLSQRDAEKAVGELNANYQQAQFSPESFDLKFVKRRLLERKGQIL